MPKDYQEESVEAFWEKAKDQENDWFYGMSLEHRQLFYNWLPSALTTYGNARVEEIIKIVEDIQGTVFGNDVISRDELIKAIKK
jgi:hypothetical protein